MAESTQVLERTEAGTVIRTGNNGQRTTLPHVLPILPIRNIVVFPGTVMPLNVGRPKSKAVLDGLYRRVGDAEPAAAHLDASGDERKAQWPG